MLLLKFAQLKAHFGRAKCKTHIATNPIDNMHHTATAVHCDRNLKSKHKNNGKRVESFQIRFGLTKTNQKTT